MKYPEFRLSYMAILGGLTSDLVRLPLTHLSWDEFGGRVLERRRFARTGTRRGWLWTLAWDRPWRHENEPPLPFPPRFGRADPGSSHFVQQFRRLGAVSQSKSEFESGACGLGEPLAGAISVSGPGGECVPRRFALACRQRIARGHPGS